eukprot:1470900-Amphidinium_carterae.1
MALVGNHFKQPATFPPWISERERASWFCVSPKSSLVLSRNYALAASALVLCYLWRRLQMRLEGARIVANKRGFNRQHVLANAAWRRTIHAHCLLVLGAFVLLASYSSASTMTCSVTMQRLHFPFLSHEKQVQRVLEVALAAWTCLMSVRFCQHTPLHGGGAAQRAVNAKSKQHVLARSMVWNLWLLMSLMCSIPAAFYSAVAAVP